MSSGPSIELVSPNISSETKLSRSESSENPVPLLGKQSGESNLVSVNNYPHVAIHANVNTKANGITRYDASNFIVRHEGEQSDLERVSLLGDKVDIVFVFDDTGSMSDEIDGAKEGVQFLTEKIDSQEIDTRYSLVTFKNEVDIKTEFTRDTDQLKTLINNLYASGGGDIPEANFDAIEAALNLEFRSDAQRIIVDITDAPSHYKGDGSGISSYTFSDVAEDINDADVTFISIAPDTDDSETSAKSLTSEVGGFWADISETRHGRNENFESVLQRITELFTSTYEIEFHTCAPPGTERDLTVEFIGDNGRDDATTKLSVPSRFDLPPECAEDTDDSIDTKSADTITSGPEKKSGFGKLYVEADRYKIDSGGSIKFTVRSGSNDLVPGSIVKVDGKSFEADQAGRAEVTFDEIGVKTVTATHPDSDTDATVTVEIIESENEDVGKQAGSIGSKSPDEALIIEPNLWRVRPGEEISFTVQNLHGDRIEDVTVEGPNESKQTNVAGTCSFVFNETGTISITAKKSGLKSDSIKIDVDKE